MNKIRDHRVARGLSQQQLGKLVGRDQSLISKLEKGMIDFDMSMADMLGNALGVPIEQLRDGNKYIPLQSAVDGRTEKFIYGRDIPVMGYIHNSNGSIMLTKRIANTKAYPQQEQYDDCFAIVADGRWRPRYRDGEKIHFNRGERPAIGKDCLIEMKNGDQFLEEFVGTTSTKIISKELNTEKKRERNRSDVINVHGASGRD